MAHGRRRAFFPHDPTPDAVPRLAARATGPGLTIDQAGKLGCAARGKNARLLHQILAFDTALEIQRLADAVDVVRGPVGDLLVGDDAHGVEFFFDQHADAANALEIVAPQRAHDLVLGGEALR